ncbi:uncharacterized protein KGF55_002443 [Candida pseudojiufengensis]|uniref:uncharacterized protein n=1 Tax=Candida pseudojiufengensis TaxID=497109 RepID=UPI00222555F2|nr:uncharacterized protein KGF55_002443 [Candida pseudojiufengensis]KAI5963563.1 hypothetical protein KGF55_002443 [Candida pseudojiufengensis]
MKTAEELKTEGNKAFALKEYKKAAKIYRDAIQLDTYNPALYSNRAQCFLNLKDYERALKDAIKGLSLTAPKELSVKLNYRKAMALLGLECWQSAKFALEEVLKLDPQNQAAKTASLKLQEKNQVYSNEGGNISIQKVDNLPSRFADLLQAKTTRANEMEITPDHHHQTSNELDKEINNLFGASNTRNNFETQSQSQSQNTAETKKRSPMHLLDALTQLPSSKKINGFKYVLNLDPQSYSELFSKSGIDTEFLNFFLDASKTALSDNIISNPNQVILSHLKQFSTFKRYDLTILMCDDNIKNAIIEVVAEKFPQDLTIYKKFIH